MQRWINPPSCPTLWSCNSCLEEHLLMDWFFCAFEVVSLVEHFNLFLHKLRDLVKMKHICSMSADIFGFVGTTNCLRENLNLKEWKTYWFCQKYWLGIGLWQSSRVNMLLIIRNGAPTLYLFALILSFVFLQSFFRQVCFVKFLVFAGSFDLYFFSQAECPCIQF